MKSFYSGMGVAVEPDAFLKVNTAGPAGSSYLTPREARGGMGYTPPPLVDIGAASAAAGVSSINFGGMLKDTLANIMDDIPKIGATLATSWISKELAEKLDLNAVEKKTNPDGSKTVVVERTSPAGAVQPVAIRIPAESVKKGMPNWVLPVGIGAATLIGVAGLMAFKKRR